MEEGAIDSTLAEGTSRKQYVGKHDPDPLVIEAASVPGIDTGTILMFVRKEQPWCPGGRFRNLRRGGSRDHNCRRMKLRLRVSWAGKGRLVQSAWQARLTRNGQRRHDSGLLSRRKARSLTLEAEVAIEAISREEVTTRMKRMASTMDA